MKSVPHLNVLILFSLLRCEAVVFTYSVFLAAKFVPYDFDDRGEIACRIGRETCSFCGSDDVETKCPEWTEDDLDRIYRSELKHVATLAAILMVYSVGPLRFGFDFRKHISTYEVSSVCFIVCSHFSCSTPNQRNVPSD